MPRFQDRFLNAFHAGMLEEAAALFTARYDLETSLTLTLDATDPPGPAVVRLDVAATEAKLTFHASLFGEADGVRPLVANRWLAMAPLLARFLRRTTLQGVVYLNVGDEGHRRGTAFSDYRSDFHLVPDPEFLAARGYEDYAARIGSDAVAWEQRIPVAFWRGSSKGRPEAGWPNQRVKLCQIGRDTEPGQRLLDVGITEIMQPEGSEEARMLREDGLVRPAVPLMAYQRYRYLIDVDGWSSSWSGLLTKLHTGSTVLKVDSPAGFRQWYYGRLLPWVHYVPVRADLADLASRVEFLTRHDAVACAVGEAGRRLAQSLGFDAELERGAEAIGAALAQEILIEGR